MFGSGELDARSADLETMDGALDRIRTCDLCLRSTQIVNYITIKSVYYFVVVKKKAICSKVS